MEFPALNRTWRHRLIDVGKPPANPHPSVNCRCRRKLVYGGAVSHPRPSPSGDGQQPRWPRLRRSRTGSAGRRPGGCRNGRPGWSKRPASWTTGSSIRPPMVPVVGPPSDKRKSAIANHHNIFRRIGERYAYTFYDWTPHENAVDGGPFSMVHAADCLRMRPRQDVGPQGQKHLPVPSWSGTAQGHLLRHHGAR